MKIQNETVKRIQMEIEERTTGMSAASIDEFEFVAGIVSETIGGGCTSLWELQADYNGGRLSMARYDIGGDLHVLIQQVSYRLATVDIEREIGEGEFEPIGSMEFIFDQYGYETWKLIRDHVRTIGEFDYMRLHNEFDNIDAESFRDYCKQDARLAAAIVNNCGNLQSVLDEFEKFTRYSDTENLADEIMVSLPASIDDSILGQFAYNHYNKFGEFIVRQIRLSGGTVYSDSDGTIWTNTLPEL
jgi:hypothetical protein